MGKCKTCKSEGKAKKMQPYGAQPGKYWCNGCDACLVSPVNKKKTRQQVKKTIREELE